MSELRNKGRESPDISSQTQDQSNKEPQKKSKQLISRSKISPLFHYTYTYSTNRLKGPLLIRLSLERILPQAAIQTKDTLFDGLNTLDTFPREGNSIRTMDSIVIRS